jgi:hypothetical protein
VRRDYNRPVTFSRWAASAALAAGTAGLLPCPAVAQSCPSGPAPIARITIHRAEVFDAHAGSGLARTVGTTANALHAQTRETVIRRELLFAVGDPCDTAALARSERHLRALGIFQQVVITVVPAESDSVAVDVRVRDAWTLKAGVNLSREGGFTSWAAKVIDTNTAGAGVALNVRRDHEFEHDVASAAVSTARLFGTRHRLDAFVDRRSDGQGAGIALARPFVTVDKPVSYAVSFSNVRDHARVYDGGDVDGEYGRRSIDANAAVTRRAGGRSGRAAWRISAGYRVLWREHTDIGLSAGTTRPLSHRYMGPIAAVQAYSERFVKRRGLAAPERDTDVNLGLTVDADVFLSHRSAAFGAEPRAFASTGVSKGWSPSDQWLLVTRGRAGVAFSGGETARYVCSGFAGAWWQPSASTVRSLTVQAQGLDRPEPGQFVYLGGTAGLRGYRQNALSGTRSVLAIIEERRYAAWTPLDLFRPGIAVFAEAGAIRSASTNRRGTGVDVGVGVRLAALRAAGTAVVAVDIAWPLVAEPGRPRRPQLVLGYRDAF